MRKSLGRTRKAGSMGRAPRDAYKRRQAAHLGSVADGLSMRTVVVTAPVYWADDSGNPETIGSATLLQFDRARFLLTAAHVLDLRHKRPLAAGVEHRLITIQGEVARIVSKDARSPAEDPIDIAVVRLAGPWAQLPDSAFADWSELDHSGAPMTRNSHLIIGYPCTKQRGMLRGDQLGAYAYRVSGLEATEATYRRVGADPQATLIVGFDRRRTWGPQGRLTAPDLYGMSGGGIWRFCRYLSTATQPPQLSAVAIEWHRSGQHKYVTGTRIRPIIAHLADMYDDVKNILLRPPKGAA
jgi:hypothetical protein